MNLGDFPPLEHNKNENNVLSNIINELKNTIENFIKSSISFSPNSLSEDSIYVVRDINDEKLSLVNIKDGDEFNIYITDSKDKVEKLHKEGISDKSIYEISKEDLYSLNLGSNITLKNGQCALYHGKIKIENPKAAAKLEDMYFCLEEEKDAIYSILNISNEKIYLTNTKEGGYFSILQVRYPDFKVGDLVKKIDGKYTLI